MKVCPKCGHPVVKASSVGLKVAHKPDFYVCSMNMPYQGCGWRSSQK